MVTRGSSSHIWCERCHKRRIHATHRYRMCRPCASLHVHELKEERRRVKDHRALRRAEDMPADGKLTVAQAVQEYVVDQRADVAVDAFFHNPTKLEAAMDSLYEATHTPAEALADPSVSQDVTVHALLAQASERADVVSPATQQVRRSYERIANEMPADLKLEIGTHYENLAVPGDVLGAEYHISNGTLMAIVAELGITKRMDRDKADRKGIRNRKPGYFVLQDGKRIWITGRKPTVAQKAYEQGKRDAQTDWPQGNLRGAMGPQHRAVKPEVEPAVIIDAPAPQQAIVVHSDVPGMTRWRVSIETVVEVECERIEDVIVQTRIQYPGANIRSINPAGR